VSISNGHANGNALGNGGSGVLTNGNGTAIHVEGTTPNGEGTDSRTSNSGVGQPNGDVKVIPCKTLEVKRPPLDRRMTVHSLDGVSLRKP